MAHITDLLSFEWSRESIVAPPVSNAIDLRNTTKRLFDLHIAAIATLVLAHLAAFYIVPIFNSEALSKISFIFGLNDENSVGNFFSGVMLIVTAGVAGLVAHRHLSTGSRLWPWWLLAAFTIAAMGFDEGAMLHDRLSRPVQEFANTGGIFYIGWTLPYLLLVVVAGFAGMPLLCALPGRTRARLIAAAALYVGSALGLEMAESVVLYGVAPEGASLRDLHSVTIPPIMGVLITLEELGEMVAVALALKALLLHLVEDLGVRHVSFGRAQGSPVA